ncbi:unnamed protein product [Mytilus coruscus]|uniref:Uncharacterized protein n=1 Tax=Mytilus coruscus TaxID=42192 RepID=A0A6J8BR61_MYTCO|nr:unnamed protein product [Mytilus coruscus]
MSHRATIEDDNAAENIYQGTTEPGQAILDIYEQKEEIVEGGQIEDLDHGEEFLLRLSQNWTPRRKMFQILTEEELLLTAKTEGERKEETEAGSQDLYFVGTVWDSIRRGSISQADISPYSNNQSLFKVSSDLDARISLDDIALMGSIPVFLPTIVAVAKITDIWRVMLFYPDNISITEFDKISIPLLSEVLAAHLTKNSPMIVTIGEFSIAFIKEGDGIWLFDSHCRSETGERCVPLGTGKAFTVPFDDIGQIAEYLEREYRNSNEYQAVSVQYSFPALD